MGEQKARRLVEALHQPFRSGSVQEPPPVRAAPQEPTTQPDTPDGAASPAGLALPDNFESLPEEEQLRIALELSVGT